MLSKDIIGNISSEQDVVAQFYFSVIFLVTKRNSIFLIQHLKAICWTILCHWV